MNARVCGEYAGYHQTSTWRDNIESLAIDYKDYSKQWDTIWVEDKNGVEYDSIEQFIRKADWI